MRTSFHHQPEAQHPNFQLSTSWSADYPIFRGVKRTRQATAVVDPAGHREYCARSRDSRDVFDPRWLGDGSQHASDRIAAGRYLCFSSCLTSAAICGGMGVARASY